MRFKTNSMRLRM